MNTSRLTQSILTIITIATLATIAACDRAQQASEADAKPEKQTGAGAAAQDFAPQYVGGYPTEETAKAAFDEYDYQAATQFYIWGYAYLNSLGYELSLIHI